MADMMCSKCGGKFIECDCSLPSRISHRKAATMSDDRVELAALALCHSGKFACYGRCAPICFEFMGHKPKRCSHAIRVHGDLARDILNTLDPSIESLQAEVERYRTLLEKAAPFVGWASTRSQVVAGVHADELCDEIDRTLAAKEQTR